MWCCSPCRRAPARRTVLQGHHRRRVPPAPKLHPHRRRTKCGRRRRRSSATLGCGMSRPPRSSVRASGRPACTAAAPTGCRATRTSPTLPERLPTASATAPKSSVRSWRTPASTATRGRFSRAIRHSGVSLIATRRSTSTGPATTSATCTWARRSTSGPSTGRTRPPSRSAASSNCRRARPTSASARARPISPLTRSSARKRRSSWKCPGSAATNFAAARTASRSPVARFAGAPA